MSVKQNTFIIIQARYNSTRLRGKILLPLCGMTVLEVMLARLANLKHHIIIATTNDGSEAPIVEVCERAGVRYFRGSLDNVLERYYLAAKEFGATEMDTVVRLTSDCPLIDPAIVKDVIEFYHKRSYDYAANILERTFPRGMDTEVFSFGTLEYIYNNAKTDAEREHVTAYIYKNQHGLWTGSYTQSRNDSRYRLTLDEDQDYAAIQEIYRLMNCRTDFTYEELIALLEANPHIYELNKDVEQKKV